MWFGLTGRNASGKTTVVEWLVENGYVSTSCSDSIRAHLRSQGMLRDEHAKTSSLVIDSIRTPAEVEALQERPDFRLIEIRASREVRWQRLQSRGRSGDPTDWDTFVAQEESELEALDDSGQALIATAEMADIIIFNDGETEELREALELLLRPDEY